MDNAQNGYSSADNTGKIKKNKFAISQFTYRAYKSLRLFF